MAKNKKNTSNPTATVAAAPAAPVATTPADLTIMSEKIRRQVSADVALGEIYFGQIDTSDTNVRKHLDSISGSSTVASLATSLREAGQAHPISVTLTDRDVEIDGERLPVYRLDDGYRRCAAWRANGVALTHRVRAIVRTDLGDSQRRFLQTVSASGKSLGVCELIVAFHTLARDYSPDMIATTAGYSPVYVRELIALGGKLAPEVLALDLPSSLYGDLYKLAKMDHDFQRLWASKRAQGEKLDIPTDRDAHGQSGGTEGGGDGSGGGSGNTDAVTIPEIPRGLPKPVAALLSEIIECEGLSDSQKAAAVSAVLEARKASPDFYAVFYAASPRKAKRWRAKMDAENAPEKGGKKGKK